MIVRCDERSVPKAPVTHHGSVKKYIKKGCLKCSERDGVLVCSNDECPIVIHKDCMRCTAYFDGEGNFYCPYCAYNRSLDRYRKAKESAVLAKKALSSFMNAKVVGSTEDEQIVGNSKRERSKLEVSKESDEIGGSRSGRVGEGTINLRSSDNVMSVRLESGNLKRQKVAAEFEGSGLQRKETQREPHGSSVCSARNDAMDIDEGSDTTDEQPEANLEDADKSAEIDTVVMSPENDASVTVEETEVILEKHVETTDVEDDNDEEKKEKDHQPLEASINLTVVNKNSVLGDVNANHVSGNSEKSGFKEHTEAVNFSIENQRNKSPMDRSYDGLAEKVQKQSVAQEPTKVMNNEATDMNCSLHEVENIPVGHMAVNENIVDQTSNIGDTHSRKANKAVQKNDANSVSKENAGLHYGEMDTGDERKSSEETRRHTGGSIRRKRKTQVSAHSETGTHPRKSVKSIHDDSTVNAVHVTVNSENAGFKQQESMTGAETVNMGTENQQNLQNKTALTETDVGVAANVHKQSEEEAKLLKSEVNYLIKEKSGVLYEEFDNNTGDERKSSQESHPTGYQLRHKPQISTPKESSGLFGDSDSDFEKDARIKRKPKVELDTPTQINDQLPPVPQSRRDRLRWTVEEEEMLKEAVNTFSLVAKKNMPWARVLQYGSHIFDGTRTPDDLRCKWKGIVRKANNKNNNGQ